MSRYPNIKELSRKDSLQLMAELASKFNPTIHKFVPPTFLFPQDAAAFKQYAKTDPSMIFIAKPVSGAQGDDIQLF